MAFQVPWVLLAALSPDMATALSPVGASLSPPGKASPRIHLLLPDPQLGGWGCPEGKEELESFLLSEGVVLPLPSCRTWKDEPTAASGPASLSEPKVLCPHGHLARKAEVLPPPESLPSSSPPLASCHSTQIVSHVPLPPSFQRATKPLRVLTAAGPGTCLGSGFPKGISRRSRGGGSKSVSMFSAPGIRKLMPPPALIHQNGPNTPQLPPHRPGPCLPCLS